MQFHYSLLANSHPKVLLKAHCDKKAHVDSLRLIASSVKPGKIKIGYVYDVINEYSVELTNDEISTVAASPEVRSMIHNTRESID
ncbi:hypothetical protein FRC12_019101 [Ceratobasidium sp. 428]|nr:hypothetical protein FRC12_019101 [Ceratobasidium sp. 428]